MNARIPIAAAALLTGVFARTGLASESIQARLDAAAPGAVVEVPPGIYREHLRITKPVLLRGVAGPNGERPVLDGGGNGDIVEITAEGVELSGFMIRDTGIDLDKENCAIRVLAPRALIADNVVDDVLFGIDLKSASDSVVRGNRIGGKDLDIARRGDGLRLWRSDRVLIEGNTIHDGRDAILWYSSGVIVRGNTSADCRYGFHLMFSDNTTIEGNHLHSNSVGLYLMYSHSLEIRGNRIVRNRGPSGYGLGLKEADRFTVAGNIFVGNRIGAYLDGSPFTIEQPGLFTGNTFAWNDVGMGFLPAVRGALVTDNNFIDNFEQISVQGRGNLDKNDFATGDRGNFWSDYVGYDEDRDGIGDWEHVSDTFFESLLDREPKLRLFALSPVQQAIEFVGRAIPAVRPEPKFSDPAPLVVPVPIPPAGDAGPQPAGLAWLAVLFASIGSLLLAAARSSLGLAGSSPAIASSRPGGRP